MNVLDFKLRQKSRRTIEVARDWLDDFGQVAFATVVATWGSAPVPIGGQLVVAPGSRFEGSVSGGCVEAEVITEAEDVMASDRPKLLEFGIAEETAWRAGLPCGGAIKIYVEPPNRVVNVCYEFLARKIPPRGAHSPDDDSIVSKRILLNVTVVGRVDRTPKHQLFSPPHPSEVFPH